MLWSRPDATTRGAAKRRMRVLTSPVGRQDPPAPDVARRTCRRTTSIATTAPTAQGTAQPRAAAVDPPPAATTPPTSRGRRNGTPTLPTALKGTTPPKARVAA